MSENSVNPRVRLEEISKQTCALYEEQRQLEAQLLDPFIGKFYKFEAVDAEGIQFLRPNTATMRFKRAAYFYAARRHDGYLQGPMVELKTDGTREGLRLEAKADGTLFYDVKHCIEISAEEFRQCIHVALDLALKPVE